MNNTLGLYLHIPFCKQKCAYCDFYSLAGSETHMDAYCAALTRHLEEVAPRCSGMTVDTVYFGGGTPSYLGAARLTSLLKTVKKRYRLAADAEITVECNPDSAGDWKALRQLRRAGFNRISLGVQSTDDALLQEIGRIHTFSQVTDAVAAARMAKIQNISLDLIYGLPHQTLEQWQDTLRTAAALEVEHLSCYGLKVEEGTPLYERRDTAALPDDDLQAEMYLWAVDYLEQNGYHQYEISNFARDGFESRHNLKYWQMDDYLGLGPSAHSFMEGERFSSIGDVYKYIEMNPDERVQDIYQNSLNDNASEFVFTALRTKDGVSLEAFKKRIGVEFWQHYKDCREEFGKYVLDGYAVCDETHIALTAKGIDISNKIMAIFV